MTEKRYSDGTLAKWYYSQTNVICDGNNEYYLRHKESVKDLNYNDLLGTNDLLDELNRLSDKNGQLKHCIKKLQNELNIYSEVFNELNALVDENEQLKEDNMLLIEDSEKYRKLSIQFDNRNKELISENKQLKSELAQIKRQEQEVIEYLQAYHNGDVKELKE